MCVSMCVYQYVDVRVYQYVCVGQSASDSMCVCMYASQSITE